MTDPQSEPQPEQWRAVFETMPPEPPEFEALPPETRQAVRALRFEYGALAQRNWRRIGRVMHVLLLGIALLVIVTLVFGILSVKTSLDQGTTSQEARHAAQSAQTAASAANMAVRQNQRLVTQAVALGVRIQTERYDSALDGCRDTNARNHHTIRLLKQDLAKATGPEGVRARAQAKETIQFLSAINPSRDCRKLALNIIAQPSVPIPPHHPLIRRR